ncbi:sensor histidine kinase [Spirosoma agri]|uniref:histidine kinase n=1 Tax=Spirosoma agri TaxID=1987381 RepID=A0A6M0IGA1_9BACT|nr:HAMP domain-containing sensor histidine kinase [Spirosoma agri]NEU66842.1 HAMP domain-containing histidine kinase [Spirosoma agri]
MSLLSQTARYLLLTAFIIALAGAVGFYTLIHRKIRYEVDEILTSQAEQAIHRLQTQPVTVLSNWDDNPHIERVLAAKQPEFTDIMLADSLTNNRPEPIRQLSTTTLVNGQMYQITVRLPYHEFNELSREMSLGVIIGFLILMALSVGVGLGLARRLWRPFYTTIDQLGSFQLDQPTDPGFPQSRIREFGLLNQSLRELTQKVRRQFSLQKQFTENASHELQTPLAVASAELELLMQSEQLTETDHAHLQRATDALSRLSQMNRSLLLLTQVENDQFSGADLLDLSALVCQYTDEYRPFFEHKQMQFSASIAPNVYQRMNRQLAGVLLTNLLKNAVRHGLPGGSITIDLLSNALIISNTGRPLPFAESQLFTRFVKDPARPDSTGLGLALVKQICDRYSLPIGYTYDSAAEKHSFQIGLR